MRIALASLLSAFITVCLLISESTTTAAQKSTADLVDLVRPAVVQVAVKITDIPRTKPIPSPLDQYFRGGVIFVVGTGFFINDAGDVVTASHVATGVQGMPLQPGIQQIIQTLEANGIHAEPRIGVSIPNVETSQLRVSGGTDLFPATLVAVDTQHDIAVFHATVNPFTNMPRTFSGPGANGLPQTKAKFVHLALNRPRDGEEIFACGFPFGEPGLVITSGIIASAWKTNTLTAVAGTGISLPIDTYWADLRVNPGNSGGPVFRPSDQAVLGMVVQLRGSLGVVVPAKYVSECSATIRSPW